VRRLLLASISVLLIAACSSCKSEAVPTGFESPSAAIDSLFRAYDIEDISQEEARRRLQARERFKLIDEPLFQSCFSDWQGEHDHALGGFVFGQLIAGKDELQITVEDGVAQVRAASASPELEPIVLVEQSGAWKIDLRQSVPSKIRQSLYEVYRRARRAERQAR
jgi:hypothetical protein